MITRNDNNKYQSRFEEVSQKLQSFYETYIKSYEWEESTNSVSSVVIKDAAISIPYKYIVSGEIKEETPSSGSKIFKDLTTVCVYVTPIEENNKKNKTLASVDSIQINGLEEYFGILKTISNYIDSNYQFLPIDEEAFEIDANTRTITLPDNDYTYAVLGDNLAENIVFEIDKYFDGMDLSSKDIAVLSRLRNDPTSGVFTPILLKDTTSKPDKIRFSWPISNKVTKQSGILEFSVRFYAANDQYVFNTTTNVLNIKNSLNFTENEDFIQDDSARAALELLNNFNIYGTSSANPPVFYYPEGYRNTTIYKNLEKNNNYTAQIAFSAMSPDGYDDSMTYYLEKKTASDTYYTIVRENSGDPIAYTLFSPDEYQEVELKFLGTFKELYKKEEDEYTLIEDIEEYRKNNTKAYVKLFGYFTVSEPAQYRVKAVIERGIRETYSRSKEIEIPLPCTFKLHNTRTGTKFRWDSPENNKIDGTLKFIETINKDPDDSAHTEGDWQDSYDDSKKILTRILTLNTKTSTGTYELEIISAMPKTLTDETIKSFLTIKADSEEPTKASFAINTNELADTIPEVKVVSAEIGDGNSTFHEGERFSNTKANTYIIKLEIESNYPTLIGNEFQKKTYSTSEAISLV